MNIQVKDNKKRGNDMMNEYDYKFKQLKSVNGYEIWKGWTPVSHTVFYDIVDPEDDMSINCFKTLAEAREYARCLR